MNGERKILAGQFAKNARWYPMEWITEQERRLRVAHDCDVLVWPEAAWRGSRRRWQRPGTAHG